MPRQYTTIGRRILAILKEGGPRKHHILVATAERYGHTEAALKRLLTAGLIVIENHKRGGRMVALAKPKA